jgi:hypothetical protein
MFGAKYAPTQETMKRQANCLVVMKNKLVNIQQFCMTDGQQRLPPHSAATHVHQPQQMQWWRSEQWPWFPTTTTMSFSGADGGQQQVICPPLPTNIGRIGTTVTPMVVILTTFTLVQRVANQDLLTTLTQAAPTLWADQLLECTKPSCRWLAATLHPIIAPGSSSALSNVHLC